MAKKQENTHENKPPESVDDVRKIAFRKTWKWFSKQSIGIKILFVILLILILLVIARLNFFGEPYYSYSRLIIPIEVPGVDPERTIVPLSLHFEIEDRMGRRTGKLGDNYYSGDHIYLSFNTGSPSWVTVFCVDSKGIQPVFRQKFSPSKVERDKTYTLEFELDDTLGREFYYAIAASKKFDFEREIRVQLKEIFPEGNSKGPLFSEYSLELGSEFTQKLIHFNHLSRQ